MHRYNVCIKSLKFKDHLLKRIETNKYKLYEKNYNKIE